MTMLRRFFTWLGEVAGGFCAAFLAFVALFGAIGVAIATPYSAEVTCWPQHSVIFVYETFCESNVAASRQFDFTAPSTVTLRAWASATP